MEQIGQFVTYLLIEDSEREVSFHLGLTKSCTWLLPRRPTRGSGMLQVIISSLLLTKLENNFL